MGLSKEVRKDQKTLLMEFLKLRLAPGGKDAARGLDLINMGKMCGRKHGLGFPWSKFGNEIKQYYYPGKCPFIDCSHQAVDVFRNLCRWHGDFSVHNGAAVERAPDEERRAEKARRQREKEDELEEQRAEEVRRELAAEGDSESDSEKRVVREQQIGDVDGAIARAKERLRIMQIRNGRAQERERKKDKPKVRAKEPLLTAKFLAGEKGADVKKEQVEMNKEDLKEQPSANADPNVRTFRNPKPSPSRGLFRNPKPSPSLGPQRSTRESKRPERMGRDHWKRSEIFSHRGNNFRKPHDKDREWTIRRDKKQKNPAVVKVRRIENDTSSDSDRGNAEKIKVAPEVRGRKFIEHEVPPSIFETATTTASTLEVSRLERGAKDRRVEDRSGRVAPDENLYYSQHSKKKSFFDGEASSKGPEGGLRHGGRQAPKYLNSSSKDQLAKMHASWDANSIDKGEYVGYAYDWDRHEWTYVRRVELQARKMAAHAKGQEVDISGLEQFTAKDISREKVDVFSTSRSMARGRTGTSNYKKFLPPSRSRSMLSSSDDNDVKTQQKGSWGDVAPPHVKFVSRNTTWCDPQWLRENHKKSLQDDFYRPVCSCSKMGKILGLIRIGGRHRRRRLCGGRIRNCSTSVLAEILCCPTRPRSCCPSATTSSNRALLAVSSTWLTKNRGGEVAHEEKYSCWRTEVVNITRTSGDEINDWRWRASTGTG
ncbi:unnamed protein product [Amoebophrya sp. A25]|nr:unnamed protein product [Amoebophrya sp. A25]|eukprot:GSA25T00011088001.1